MSRMKSVIGRVKSNPLLIDSFWAVFGSVLTKGLAFLSAIIVARFLQKELYGEFGFIRNMVINIGMLSTFGLGYTATKFIAETKDEKDSRLVVRSAIQITALISLILAILLFIFSKQLATDYFGLPHLTFYLKVVAGWLVLNAITTTQTGILAGFGAFKKMARYNLYIGLFTFLLSVLGVYFYSLSGAVFSLVIAQVANVILFSYLIGQYKGQTPVENTPIRSLYKRLIIFSTPVALQEIIYCISSILVYVVVLRSSDVGELGLFTAAMQWCGIVLFVPSILRNVMLKHFAANNDDSKSLRHIVKRSLLMNFVVTVLPVLILILFYPLVFKLYGNSFQGLFLPVLLLLISTIFMSVNTVYNQFFMSIDRNWMMFWMRLLRDGGVLALGYFFIQLHVVGAAASMGIAYLVANVLYFIALIMFFTMLKPNNSGVEV